MLSKALVPEVKFRLLDMTYLMVIALIGKFHPRSLSNTGEELTIMEFLDIHEFSQQGLD